MTFCLRSYTPIPLWKRVSYKKKKKKEKKIAPKRNKNFPFRVESFGNQKNNFDSYLNHIEISDNEKPCVLKLCDIVILSQEANFSATRPRGYRTFFMLISAEHEICPANKSQISNYCKFFLTKHCWAWRFLC